MAFNDHSLFLASDVIFSIQSRTCDQSLPCHPWMVLYCYRTHIVLLLMAAAVFCGIIRPLPTVLAVNCLINAIYCSKSILWRHWRLNVRTSIQARTHNTLDHFVGMPTFTRDYPEQVMLSPYSTYFMQCNIARTCQSPQLLRLYLHYPHTIHKALLSHVIKSNGLKSMYSEINIRNICGYIHANILKISSRMLF